MEAYTDLILRNRGADTTSWPLAPSAEQIAAATAAALRADGIAQVESSSGGPGEDRAAANRSPPGQAAYGAQRRTVPPTTVGRPTAYPELHVRRRPK